MLVTAFSPLGHGQSYAPLGYGNKVALKVYCISILLTLIVLVQSKDVDYKEAKIGCYFLGTTNHARKSAIKLNLNPYLLFDIHPWNNNEIC